MTCNKVPMKRGSSGTIHGILTAASVLALSMLIQGEEASSLKLTDKQGRELEAAILGEADGKVKLRRHSDGREFSIPLDSLSASSQQSIKKALQAITQQAEAAAVGDLDIPDPVLAQLKTRWTGIKAGIPQAVQPAQLQMGLSKLVDILILENDLITAASPKDPSSPLEWPKEIDRQTQDKVLKLRQEIRDKERGALLKRMGEDLGSKKFSSSRSDRERLNSLYDSTLRPLKRDLAKAQKALAKERDSNLPDEREITELQQTVDGLNAAIANLRFCFFGIDAEEWWIQKTNWPEDHEAEELRKEISEARRKFHELLIKAANHQGEHEYKLAEIDGESFYSANFGVMLDVSGSMTPHIEKLKKDIEGNFSSPLYREVVGCMLRVEEKEGHLRPGMHADTMFCIQEMLMIYKVDTIYWFCDLNDPRSEEALHHLGNLLRHSGARLFIRSVNHKPDRELKALIDDF